MGTGPTSWEKIASSPLVLAIILTPVFELLGAKRGKDSTEPSDYAEELVTVGPAETELEALG